MNAVTQMSRIWNSTKAIIPNAYKYDKYNIKI